MKRLLVVLPLATLGVQGWSVTERPQRRWSTSLDGIARTQQRIAPPPVRASPIPKLSNEGFLKRMDDQLEKMKLKDAKSPLLSKEVSITRAATDGS
jgi:hypothetical protein